MLQRMLAEKEVELNNISIIVSGGAVLKKDLIQDTFNKLGPVLFNLYGSSEAGLSAMATPQDLKIAPGTIGKELAGVQLKILNDRHQDIMAGSIGRICIKSNWTIKVAANNNLIETGDLGYKDENGYYFLCGRVDEMIISGGENVYPQHLEEALLQHHSIKDAYVMGVHDNDFGQRLMAYVVPHKYNQVNKELLYSWLRNKVPAYYIPSQIIMVDELPYNSLGKIKKAEMD